VRNPVTAECTPAPANPSCALVDSVRASLNVPIYDVIASLTPRAVLSMAHDAGIQSIWDNSMKRHDLGTEDLTGVLESGVGIELGLGQNPVTLTDMATAMATFGAGGLYARARFVDSVTSVDGWPLYGYGTWRRAQQLVIEPGPVADLDYALKDPDGSQLAIMSGEWPSLQYLLPGQATSVGYNSRLAAAIWIGRKTDEAALIDHNHAPIWGHTLPKSILQNVLMQSGEKLGLTPAPFPSPVFGGDPLPPGSVLG